MTLEEYAQLEEDVEATLMGQHITNEELLADTENPHHSDIGSYTRQFMQINNHRSQDFDGESIDRIALYIQDFEEATYVYKSNPGFSSAFNIDAYDDDGVYIEFAGYIASWYIARPPTPSDIADAVATVFSGRLHEQAGAEGFRPHISRELMQAFKLGAITFDDLARVVYPRLD